MRVETLREYGTSGKAWSEIDERWIVLDDHFDDAILESNRARNGGQAVITYRSGDDPDREKTQEPSMGRDPADVLIEKVFESLSRGLR